jgi:hypothetical protein
MKYLIAVLITIVLSSITLANQPKDSLEAQQKNNEKTEQLVHENQLLSNQKSEIVDVLKWSIGSILIIIIALLGSSVYFNFRLSRKEIDNINKGIELEIKNFKIDLEKNISEKIAEFEKSNNVSTENIRERFVILEKELNTKIDRDNTKLLDGFQNQLDEFNSNYRQQVSTIEKSLSSQIMTNENLVEQLKNSLLEKINSNSEKIDNNNKYVLELIEKVKKSITASIERNAGYMWEARNVLSNALNAYRRECEIHIELGNDFMIGFSLGSMKDIAKQMGKIESSNQKNIERLFDKLPSKYDDSKAELREYFNKE